MRHLHSVRGARDFWREANKNHLIKLYEGLQLGKAEMTSPASASLLKCSIKLVNDFSNILCFSSHLLGLSFS